ncbi:MAG: ribonuclease III [Desulfuromonas sp.]|jgi:ribonuclease-3|uniref:ribonuclease III n=1 Tax=Desulfuromonas thiophila TaxID=57664 RepID=UPI0024A8D8D5|nr:ribonuclease III [Desulfuromonas thiophila]MDD3800692.1 ribonuclease III [Desulfuromonas thiophila]MDY0398046.1 ribonuclease III [Desulfuromonas thiophila]
MLDAAVKAEALPGYGSGRGRDLGRLQQRLNYHFHQVELLRQALVHKSYANETLHDLLACNERLEFLGDAVLDLVIAGQLYGRFPRQTEGELSRLRAELVSTAALAQLARELRLGEFLLLGRGERRSGGCDKDSLLADALEAVLGAVFLDGGWAATQQVVEPLFAVAIEQVAVQQSHDYKSRLQEVCQALFASPPRYELTDQSGPDHQPLYQVAVFCGSSELGCGTGRSKKAAEQQAAATALQRLRGEIKI